jgi:hypothetical protein
LLKPFARFYSLPALFTLKENKKIMTIGSVQAADNAHHGHCLTHGFLSGTAENDIHDSVKNISK